MNRRAACFLAALAALAAFAPRPARALPDFRSFVPGGWADAIVALPAASATATFVPLPVALTGGVTSFVNGSVIQSGTTASPAAPGWSWRLDGGEFAGFGLGAYNPGVYAWANNVPVVVRGGRHTLEQMADPAGVVAELNEVNNDYSRQFYWTPPELPAHSIASHPAPPERTGGWAGLPSAVTRTINTDSYRLPNSTGAPGDGPWQVVAVHVPTQDSDVDLHVFGAGVSALDVFAMPIQTSQFADDETDYIVVNRAAFGSAPLDVAAVNSGGSTDFLIERRGTGSVVGFGNAWIEDSLAASQAVAIHAFHVDASPLPISIEVGRDGTAGLGYEVFSPLQPISGRAGGMTFRRLGHTDPALRSQIGNMEPGDYALVIFRTGNDGFAPLRYRFRVRPAPGELRPFTPEGWAASIVPRRMGSPDGVDNPVTPLEGWTPTTYMNLAVTNDSPTPATPVAAAGTFDGGVFGAGYLDTIPALTSAAWFASNLSLRGGRHTLGVWADPADQIAEFDEADNQDARQWVWSGLAIVNDSAYTRPCPAPRTAGHAAIPPDTARAFNADGYRTPLYRAGRSDGFWGAVGITPLSTTVDLDLHAFLPSTGPRDGYVTPVSRSVSPFGLTDILLFDIQDTGSRSLDVGVVDWDGTANFRMQSTISHYDAGGSSNHFGTYTIPQGRILSVIEAPPGPAGTVTWRLRNLDGTTDLALALVPRHLASGNYSMSDERDAGHVVDVNGNGADEFLTASMPTDYYALVVFRPNAASLAQGPARFTITTSGPGTTGADDVAPAAVAFAGASPNPVRGATTMRFDLPAAQHVTLALYDVAGKRVATLADGPWAAGRHAVAWDGRGTDGRELAAGLYFARFDAGTVHASRKVTLVH